MIFILLLLPSVTALVDCIDGFIGRMQASVQDNFHLVNETRMCSAAFCIKVFVHGALDDDEVFHQGISSRCAYTGGDRQLCVTTEGGCTTRYKYDGMQGNFTLCCCQSTGCNVPVPSDLTSIYNSHSSRRSQESSSNLIEFIFLISTYLFLIS